MSTAAKILLANLIVVRLRVFFVATTRRTCKSRRLRDMWLHCDVCKKSTASAPWRGIPMAAAYGSGGGVSHLPGLAEEESASTPDASEIFIITRHITRHTLYILSCVGCQKNLHQDRAHVAPRMQSSNLEINLLDQLTWCA